MLQLQLRQLSKDYPGTPGALQGFDLDVERGELVAVVGPSGCGKSTLLRLVAGLETPSRGQIRIAGDDVTQQPARERAVALVFQEPVLLPHLSVRDNIGFGLKLRRTPPPERQRRITEAAERTRIAPLLERWPATLSGGEAQRAALARALVREPKLFLFDEPLSQLDARMRAELRLGIRRLHEELQATTIFVTHDQAEALSLGDRVVVLRSGEIEQTDAPAALYERPRSAFVADFIGSPGMNLVRCRVEGEASSPSLVCGAFSLSSPPFSLSSPPFSLSSPPEWMEALRRRIGEEVTLGFRAEQLRGVAAGEDASFEAVVRAVEVQAADRLLQLEAGDLVISARCPAAAAPAVGETRGFRLAQDGLHLFDAKSGLRIESKLGAGSTGTLETKLD